MAELVVVAVVVGASETRIAYNAFLSHSQLKHYLSVLTDKGMVKHDPSTQTYKTIEKGLGFLEPTVRWMK